MHIYELDGQKYPSVTTIIHCLGNDAIIKWANHLGFKHQDYTKVMDESSKFGTKVHAALQREVEGNDGTQLEFADFIERTQVTTALGHFRRLMQSYEYETIFTEKTLISPKLGYAGTLDWLTKINFKYLMLMDFKTSKMVRFTMLLQLGGYSNLLKEAGYNLDGAGIILVNPKLSTLYPINNIELQFYAEAFQKLADYYLTIWQKDMKSDPVFGNLLKSKASEN
ncbi:MAG: hypothetical protein NC548_06250 [Lachnospiraceae bacterium]|nr:hypothetical protein [Lachnospiraceae bacterium]